jgi:IclR family pca regulon transcriptional regulator
MEKASLARGLAVIQAFSQHKRRVSIAQISHKTGIPRAAVRRCLYTLISLGYVTVEDGRNFSLRPKILSLGHAYLSSEPLASLAQPLLDQVSAQLHESCSIAVLEADEIVYIARSTASRRIMSIELRAGSRLPAYCTSMGRVLLSGLPEAELNGYLSRVKLTPLTNRTVSSREKFKAILDSVHRAGYAIVDQELEIGLRSIAVPIKDANGRVAAALNIGTHASRISIAQMEGEFLPHLRNAAQELGMLLH